MWYDHGMTGYGWVLMAFGTVVFWALLIGAVVLLVRALGRRGEPGDTKRPRVEASAAEGVLAERFARGEIDEAEYRQRLAVLRGASPSTTRD
ncbi:SHOCT domain-containing protein [Streptacidiphilus rugosus]|uniref:SHOCT domain-containing protein n=1 Tax=Streptacidiphilus rugosus TaxID=405783 RepID=UPI0005687808|nr:SHOCT domain-containing protein [Streptacidiphilus rugosus]